MSAALNAVLVLVALASLLATIVATGDVIHTWTEED